MSSETLVWTKRATMIVSAVAFASTEPAARRRYVVPAVTLDVALGVGALVEGARAHNALAAAVERYNSALRPPIFRRVSFPPFDTITLGEALPQRPPPTVSVGPRRAAFAQRLGDADSIFVEWDAGKRVRVLEFLYPSTKSVTKAAEDYEGLIGVDERHAVSDSAGQRLERWSWRDQATTFELSSLTGGGKSTRVWSILRDRAHSR